MEGGLSIQSKAQSRRTSCRPWEAEVLSSFMEIDAVPGIASLPRYRQIYAVLHLALSRRQAPLSRLPHERLLAAHFGAARVTVRKALGVLSEEGRLSRTCGRGTFVIERPPAASRAA